MIRASSRVFWSAASVRRPGAEVLAQVGAAAPAGDGDDVFSPGQLLVDRQPREVLRVGLDLEARHAEPDVLGFERGDVAQRAGEEGTRQRAADHEGSTRFRCDE
ncbi:MAG: hypothetical protein C0505_09965 [Leptothrix sp. (in: Bacteria)]|nr:hypothetical protein [Leptothrix sp. (in: b-proteobacteria)]